MDVVIGTTAIGVLCGPLLARAAYVLSVPFDTARRTSCQYCDAPLPSSPASWVVWTGRCRARHEHLGPRVWLVTAVSAAAGALVGRRVGGGPEVLEFSVFAALCVVLAFVDIAVQRLPDLLTGSLAVLGVVGLGAASLHAHATAPMLRAALGTVLTGGLFLVLALARPDGTGMGLGDAKLAAVLGLHLAWLGWRDMTTGILSGTLLAAVYAAVMVAVGRMSRESSVTYGPFLLVGTALAFALG